MIKKLLSVIVLAAVGVLLVRKVRGPSVDSSASLDLQPQRIPAETLEVRTEVPPESEPHDRHALRPSPVPRERPVWSPPVEETSTGKHAFRDDDTTSKGDTDR